MSIFDNDNNDDTFSDSPQPQKKYNHKQDKNQKVILKKWLDNRKKPIQPDFNIVNKDFFNQLNHVEKAIFIAQRDSMLTFVPKGYINNEAIDYVEEISKKFVLKLPDILVNLEEILIEIDRQS